MKSIFYSFYRTFNKGNTAIFLEKGKPDFNYRNYLVLISVETYFLEAVAYVSL